MNIGELISSAYSSSANYLWKLVTHPFDFPNAFTFLIGVSLFVWMLEIVLPWRKKQAVFRRGFWMDSFYMFFNYFLFSLIGYAALSKVSYSYFSSGMEFLGLPKGSIVNMTELPQWAQIIIFFLIYDFVQWVVHVVLHRVPFLWKFHKVHHSVTEMGFAAHLRYHFLEAFVYDIVKFMFITYLFNFQIHHAFWIYYFTTLIGHLNHANLGWDYGPLKYLLNNPKMHIWHHAKDLPSSHPHGMNFGLTLSIWDYIFRTNYIPEDGRDIALGFPGIEEYPDDFITLQYKPFVDHEG